MIWPLFCYYSNTIFLERTRQLIDEDIMDTKKEEKKTAPKNSSSSGFFPFAAFVFVALAVGLVVILIRSQA